MTYYRYRHVSLLESANKAKVNNQWPNRNGFYKVTLCEFAPTEDIDGTYDLKDINQKLQLSKLQWIWTNIKNDIKTMWITFTTLMFHRDHPQLKDSKVVYNASELESLKLSPDMFLEYGTPLLDRYKDPHERLKRLMRVDLSNLCAGLYFIQLVHDPITDVYAFEGAINPSGPKGPLLKTLLDNPEHDVGFSLLSLSNCKNYIKTITHVVTFDVIHI